MIDEQTKSILTATGDVALAKWWYLLNSWEWPAELPDPELQRPPVPNRRSAIMRVIEQRIGFKECLREWNRERMPGALFDEWFAETFPHYRNPN